MRRELCDECVLVGDLDAFLVVSKFFAGAIQQHTMTLVLTSARTMACARIWSFGDPETLCARGEACLLGPVASPIWGMRGSVMNLFASLSTSGSRLGLLKSVPIRRSMSEILGGGGGLAGGLRGKGLRDSGTPITAGDADRLWTGVPVRIMVEPAALMRMMPDTPCSDPVE